MYCGDAGFSVKIVIQERRIQDERKEERKEERGKRRRFFHWKRVENNFLLQINLTRAC